MLAQAEVGHEEYCQSRDQQRQQNVRGEGKGGDSLLRGIEESPLQ